MTLYFFVIQICATTILGLLRNFNCVTNPIAVTVPGYEPRPAQIRPSPRRGHQPYSLRHSHRSDRSLRPARQAHRGAMPAGPRNRKAPQKATQRYCDGTGPGIHPGTARFATSGRRFNWWHPQPRSAEGGAGPRSPSDACERTG